MEEWLDPQLLTTHAADLLKPVCASLLCPACSHSFGYDSMRRGNLQPLDENTLLFMAGNVLVLLDVATRRQRYLRSCSGGGIGAIAVR